MSWSIGGWITRRLQVCFVLGYFIYVAYHSCVCAWVGEKVMGNRFIELGASRGYETIESKVYMRGTVIVSDGITFIPAVLLFISLFYKDSYDKRLRNSISNYIISKEDQMNQVYILLFILCSPLFILIDHGHFQYNCVCLGLIVYSIYFIYLDYDCLAGFFYVSSLCFKQTALYIAPCYFCYFLGKYMKYDIINFIKKLSMMGSTVILSFILYFAPFLHSLESIQQVLHRIFPFARGIFEDKVANFWCASNMLFRWKSIDISIMSKISLGTTLLSLLPMGYLLMKNPSKLRFSIALIPCSLSFFMFSFQVHEKSILFVLLPVVLLFGCSEFLNIFIAWFVFIANLSLLPLLEKDGLIMYYYIFQIAFLSITYNYFEISNKLLRYSFRFSILLSILIHVYWHFGPIFSRYPDIKQLLIATYSALHFGLFYIGSLALLYYFQDEKNEKELNYKLE